MKHHQLRGLLALCLLATANAPATVLYVDVNSASPTPPFTNWSTAAVTIQDAVDAALAGDQILVTNGVYQTGGKGDGFGSSNRVAVDKSVTIQSVDGPQVTAIQGTYGTRCVFLGNGAALAGFTLTNGNLSFLAGGFGGGVAFKDAPSDAVVSNCVIVDCVAVAGGGAASATSTGNTPEFGGGTLVNCLLTNNQVSGLPGSLFDGPFGGAAKSCRLINCTLAGNGRYANSPVPVVGGGAYACVLQNCLLVGNTTTNSFSQGPGGAAAYSVLTDCTVAQNSGGPGAGVYSCWLTNCIVCDNQGDNHAADNFVAYSCTTPMPTNGADNITNAPLFVDSAAQNFRLQSNSPCIDAGNNSNVATATDLDRRLRIVRGRVDMGAYEFQPGVSGEFLGWLSQFGLPTDGSADYSDSDSDGGSNWQEWIAGTIPIDPSSALRLLNPAKAVSGVTVSWQSVTNRTYFLERASSLGAAPSFSLLTSNLVGQAGTTSYNDTNAVGPGPFFYRVGVQ
jgi:hypothetical protein